MSLKIYGRFIAPEPEPPQGSEPGRATAAGVNEARSVAAPALSFTESERGGAPLFLLVILSLAIGLLAIATTPPARARRGGITAAALSLRLEIALAGALLLLLSAVAFFLTA